MRPHPSSASASAARPWKLACLACLALSALAWFPRPQGGAGSASVGASIRGRPLGPLATPKPTPTAASARAAKPVNSASPSLTPPLKWVGPADASSGRTPRENCDVTTRGAPDSADVDHLLASLVKTQPAPPTVIDVGANKGQTAAVLATAGAGHVISFEPHPRTCGAFLDAADRLPNTTRVDLVCAGVGAAAGLAQFIEAPASTSFMQRPDGFKAPPRSKVVAVPILPLDAALKGLGVGTAAVSILKTDTQGREAGVLLGYGPARLAATAHVVLEYSYGLLGASGTDRVALLDFLADAGFACSFLEKRVVGGAVPWPAGMSGGGEDGQGACVGFEYYVEAVKGGWTNLWCVNGRADGGGKA